MVCGNGSAEGDLRHLRQTEASVLFVYCLLLFLPPSPAGAAEVVILKSANLAAYNQAVAGFNATLPLAVGVKAALVAKLEIVDIPVIFCMVLDPAKHDLRAPNMTGIRLDVPVERQFRTMRSVLPPVKKIGVLYDPEKTGDLVAEGRLMARAVGFEMIARAVHAGKDVPAALRALLPQVEALWLVPDSTVLTEDSLPFVMGTALDTNVPVIGFSSELVRSGALVGLSVSYEDIGRQASVLARKIFSEPARSFTAMLPPERLRLSLNLKTARFLGIVIPPEVVSNADELY